MEGCSNGRKTSGLHPLVMQNPVFIDLLMDLVVYVVNGY